MKKVYFIAFCLLILFAGCKKSNLDPISNSVIGKWTFVESRIGIGTLGDWQAVRPPGQTIEFKNSGAFVGASSFLTSSLTFQFVDSAKIKFEPSTTSSGYLVMGYSIDTVARELIMYNVEPACIEGCAYKFRR